jgi:ABC-type antimicrobial peptide transport system permease subunit
MSSSAGFPINDLLRRRVQTGIVITTLTLSIASTLFLLLFSSRLGIGIASASNTLTLGLTTVFTQFITFIGILIFIVGAILTSFIVSLMMAQRTRDFGLIKAAGCPNSLVGGYFMTELLSVATISCLLGLISGFLADYIVVNIVFGDYALTNWWFAPLIFVLFFGLIVFFVLQPISKPPDYLQLRQFHPLTTMA